MRRVTRRKILKSTGVTAGIACIAGCLGGGGQTDTTTATTTSQDLSINLAVPVASNNDVNWWYGVKEIAPEEFGLQSEADVMQGGRDIMLQATLSGQANAFRGSPTDIMQLAEQGKPMSYIGLDNAGTGYSLIGRPEYETLEDVVEKDARIGMASSITGLSGFQVVATLMAEGVIDDVSEVEDQFVQIGYSSDRLVALENGDIDVSPQFYVQWLDVQESHPDWHLISEFGKVLEHWGTYGWIAPPESVERNRESLVAMLKGIQMANEEIVNDQQLYLDLVNKHVNEPPSNENLKVNWEQFVGMDYWQTPLTTSEETINFMGEVMVQLGMLESVPEFNEVVNNSLAQEAADQLG